MNKIFKYVDKSLINYWVWESDYIDDPDGVVERCVKFLKGE